MKLLIDIPEEYYKVITDIPNRQCTVDMLIIKNGTPLEDIKEQYDKGYKDGLRETFIAEFEKIKAEIKELAFLFDDLSPDKELVVDLDNIEEVIDKHISELKGEQE